MLFALLLGVSTLLGRLELCAYMARNAATLAFGFQTRCKPVDAVDKIDGIDNIDNDNDCQRHTQPPRQSMNPQHSVQRIKPKPSGQQQHRTKYLFLPVC